MMQKGEQRVKPPTFFEVVDAKKAKNLENKQKTKVKPAYVFCKKEV